MANGVPCPLFILRNGGLLRRRAAASMMTKRFLDRRSVGLNDHLHHNGKWLLTRFALARSPPRWLADDEECINMCCWPH